MSKTNTIKIMTRFITTHLSFLDTIIAIKSCPSTSGDVCLFLLLALFGGLLDVLQRTEDRVSHLLGVGDAHRVGGTLDLHDLASLGPLSHEAVHL